jgi:hypothetical protein
VIPFADVTTYGGLDPDGEEHKKCRLTMNGKPAAVVLYAKSLDEDKWVPIDQLTNAKIVENANGSLTITGTSHELMHTVGTKVGNSEVRWEVRPRGCVNC